MKSNINEPEVKLLKLGQSSLSDAENLSLIIGGKQSLDRASAVLKKINYDYGKLVRLSYKDLLNEGLSNCQALSIISSFELSRRKNIYLAEDIYIIKMSKYIFDLMNPILEDLVHEEFWVVFLNRTNRVIGKIKLSQGGINGTVTDVRIIMKKAIEYLASGIIVCHNHPSGNLNPSESDTKITQKIKNAGDIMDIQLLDHIIIGIKEYYSFADNGLL